MTRQGEHAGCHADQNAGVYQAWTFQNQEEQESRQPSFNLIAFTDLLPGRDAEAEY